MIKILTLSPIFEDQKNFEALIKESFPDALLLLASDCTIGADLSSANNPDVIFLDSMLPEKDWIGLCSRLKSEVKSKDIPIVFISPSDKNIDSRMKALNSGADAFLNKPFDKVELIAVVKTMARLKLSTQNSHRDSKLSPETPNPSNQIEDEDLTKSEERFKQVAKSSGIWVWEVNAEGLYTYSSESEESILGYKQDEVIGKKHFYDFFAPSVKDDLKKAAFEAFANKSSFLNFENPNIHKDGHVVILETNGSPLLDKEGNLIGYRGSDKDITASKKIEDELRASEELFRSVVQNSSDFTALTDENDCVVFISPQWEKMLGFKGEDYVGKIMPIHFHPEDAEQCKQTWDNVKANSEDVKNFEYRILDISGNVRWLSHTTKHVKIAGNKMCVQSTISDITERKLADDKIREKDIQFRKLSANVPDLIFQFTRRPDGSYYVPIASEGIRNIFGCSPEDVLDNFEPIGRVIYPDDAVRVIDDIEYSAKNLSYFTCEFRVQVPGRDIQWIYSRSTPEKLSDGSITWYGFNIDITTQKKAEEELRNKNTFIETVLDNLPIGVALNKIDEGTASYMNKKFVEIYGWSAAELTDITSFLQRIYPDEEYRKELTTRIMTDIQSGDTSRMHWEDCMVTHKDGSQHIVNAVNIPLWDQNIMVSTAFDVTDQRNALARAEESDRLKSALLNNMSHEVRTPMNAIMGFSNLLPEADEKDRKTYAEIIQVSSSHLLKLLDDIILLSRLQSEKLPVNRAICKPSELVNYVYQMFQLGNLNHGLEINIRFPETYAGLNIQSDEDKIRQILLNLVSNAVKYTTKGSIDIGFDVIEDQVQFFVKDTGIGIPEKEQHKIFETFYRGENALSLAIRGNGLGLNIAKELVDLLGGSISVTSQLLKGSNFFFSIPIGQPEDGDLLNSTVKKAGKSSASLTILIAEDEVYNFEFIRLLLKDKVKRIDHALNGEKAVEMASKTNYDLILMDLKMPVMDGFEATRILKKHFPDLPIIAQTAYTFNEAKDLALQAGCDSFIVKPINKEKLLEVINDFI